MDIDVTKLSASELRELKKQVEKEIKDRDDVTSKGQMGFSEDLCKIFDIQFRQDKVGFWSMASACSRICDCIYKLADYTFHNYKVAASKKNGGEIAPKINGTLIGLDDKATDYKAMCNEIANVVKKYSKEAQPMNDYLIWAIDKYLETHRDMEWDKAADYVAEHVEELGEEFSIDAYLKEHPEAERFGKREE